MAASLLIAAALAFEGDASCSQSLVLSPAHARATLSSIPISEMDSPMCLNISAFDAASRIGRELIVGIEVLPRTSTTLVEKVCLRVEALFGNGGRHQGSLCNSYSWVEARIDSTSSASSFRITPSYTARDSFKVAARHFAVQASFLAASSGSKSSTPPPPPSPVRAPDSCGARAQIAIEDCKSEAATLKCPTDDADEELNCLEKHKAQITHYGCLSALDELHDCSERSFFIPMEIASMLLLATASAVLACTLVRCCCRYFCAAPRRRDHDDHMLDDPEPPSDDEEPPIIGSVSPLPVGVTVGVKRNESKQEADGGDGEETEDQLELPAYTEVVEGATVLPPAAR